jgi:hypothetical protein
MCVDRILIYSAIDGLTVATDHSTVHANNHVIYVLAWKSRVRIALVDPDAIAWVVRVLPSEAHTLLGWLGVSPGRRQLSRGVGRLEALSVNRDRRWVSRPAQGLSQQVLRPAQQAWDDLFDDFLDDLSDDPPRTPSAMSDRRSTMEPYTSSACPITSTYAAPNAVPASSPPHGLPAPSTTESRLRRSPDRSWPAPSITPAAPRRAAGSTCMPPLTGRPDPRCGAARRPGPR